MCRFCTKVVGQTKVAGSGGGTTRSRADTDTNPTGVFASLSWQSGRSINLLGLNLQANWARKKCFGTWLCTCFGSFLGVSQNRGSPKWSVSLVVSFRTQPKQGSSKPRHARWKKLGWPSLRVKDAIPWPGKAKVTKPTWRGACLFAKTIPLTTCELQSGSKKKARARFGGFLVRLRNSLRLRWPLGQRWEGCGPKMAAGLKGLEREWIRHSFFFHG